MMRSDYHPLLNRIAWVLLLLLLPTWGLTELMLSRWGSTRYPINTHLRRYRAPTDLLFLGDSRMSAGINPLVLDQELPQDPTGQPVLSSHNLGVQATSFGIQYLILERVIEQQKTPRVVILGYVYNELTETFFFESPDLAELSDRQDWPLLRNRSLQDMDAFLDLVLQSMSRVYRYRFHIRHVLARRADQYLSDVSEARSQPHPHRTPQQVQPDRPQPSGASEETTPQQRQAERERGFQRHVSLNADLENILAREAETYQDWFWKVDNWDDDPEQTFLADMIALSRAHGVELIFVKMPTTRLYTQMEARSPHVDTYQRRLDRYLQAHQIPHYDLSESMPDRVLWDTIHLTPEGAEQFTRVLYRQIIQPRLDQWAEQRR